MAGLRKRKIYLTAFPDLFKGYIEELPKGVEVLTDLQELLSLVRGNEIHKVCIYMDADNCPGTPGNCVRGQGAAERIHEIDPTIPILIWNGREHISDDDTIPAQLQLFGETKPIRFKEELYMDYYPWQSIISMTTDFFKGSIKEEDTLITEYLEVSFLR